jgi:hypothetical protein
MPKKIQSAKKMVKKNKSRTNRKSTRKNKKRVRKQSINGGGSKLTSKYISGKQFTTTHRIYQDISRNRTIINNFGFTTYPEPRIYKVIKNVKSFLSKNNTLEILKIIAQMAKDHKGAKNITKGELKDFISQQVTKIFLYGYGGLRQIKEKIKGIIGENKKLDEISTLDIIAEEVLDDIYEGTNNNTTATDLDDIYKDINYRQLTTDLIQHSFIDIFFDLGNLSNYRIESWLESYDIVLEVLAVYFIEKELNR